MQALRFGAPIKGLPGFRADAELGNTLFEVLNGPRDARQLRGVLLRMARIAAAASVHRIVLVLEEPRITTERLREEWEGAAAVLRPEIFSRLSLAVRQGGQWSGTPNPPKASEHAVLEEILKHELAQQPPRSTKGSDAHYEILRILLHHWLLNKGPVPISALMEISGTSHPTVSRAIARLEHCVKRHSDRSVELRFFPRDEWARLVAMADDVRGTVRFADRSGQPRSSESLLRRLQQLKREDIALGGVRGAKHYQPSLDLVGEVRLDLSVHSSGTSMDLSFVDRLDPGLVQTKRRDESPTLVVHAVRRAHSLFVHDGRGQQYADPVECLLDLHEARLEAQALEFLRSFPVAKGQSL